MWINVSDIKWLDDRRATAVITPNDLADAGFPSMDLRKVLDAPEFSEDFIRQLLTAKYGDCSRWCLHCVQWNLCWNCIDVMVSSPEFDTVQQGYHAPRLERPESK